MKNVSKIREIEVAGFKVEVHDFDYAQFFYPSFNGNAEFKVTREGFRKLSSYLRTVKWMQSNLSIFN